MKIKSFLLLGLTTIFSMNAFAAAGDDFKKDGIVYNVINDAARTVEVKGVFDGTYTSINIPATVANGGITWAVTGFAASWSSAQTATSPEIATEAVTATKMTVDVSNFAASPGLTIPTSVTELIVKGTSQNDFTIPTGTAVTNLDASELTAATGKTLKLTSFSSTSTIKEVALNANITDVAFYHCTSLVKISGVKTVVKDAFNGCTALTTVSLAEGATLAESAFDGASALATINMGVATEIGKNAFKGTAITAIDLSAAKKIDVTAFNGVGVTTLTIPAQVEEIAKWAFDGMGALATVNINLDNAKLTKIGQWFGSHTVANVTINTPQVTEIEDNAFYGEPIADGKLSITAPKLAKIGSKAFNAALLTKVNFNSLTELATVADDAFAANAYTEVQLGLTKLTAVPACFITGSSASLTKLGLPANMTNLAGLASLKALKALDLPKNLTTIAKNALKDCEALESVTIPAKVEKIDENAFDGCKALANVDFSQATKLTFIGGHAFKGTAITSIDLSACAELATIASGSAPYPAFPENLYTSVKLGGTNIADADAQALIDPTSTVYMFKGVDAIDPTKTCKTTLKEITLPAAITAIPQDAFTFFTALTSVSLPKAVTTIGQDAFSSTGLTAFKIRENVTTIGDYAFQNCADLAIVNFSEATALTSIGSYAFSSTAIKEVAIPANADATKTLTIKVSAFEDCAKLKSFSAKSWAGKLADNLFTDCVKMTGIVIPTTIDEIGVEAFKGCEALATVTFKYGAKDAGLIGATSGSNIGINKNAFEGCASLATLDLSATKLTALNQADIFLGCTSLATITFPEELTALGNGLGAADGLFFDCPIEELNAPNVTVSDNLFGWDNTNSVLRTAKTANTTLKSVTIGGIIPANAFAYCTALEDVTVIAAASPVANTVDANAFDHCTALKTFTYEPEAAISVKPVNDNAFVGCVPFVKFVTNNFYWDANPTAPMNATYGTDEITIVKTVQDKKNENQFFAKYYNTALNVEFDADECKLFTVYVDGETAYFQACRTYDGKYYVPVNKPVIVKTSEAKEVKFKPCTFPTGVPTTGSLGWNDMYCSQPGDDLAKVQAGAKVAAGKYLYRLTNTDEIGFGFTFFSGTNIKEGQFFIACEKKPEGAGRLNEVWLDEDGNVIESDATAIKGVKKALDQNDGAIYNLQGVRVQKAQKGGIYIQNGKKFVVK